jgi:hypothetical protein
MVLGRPSHIRSDGIEELNRCDKIFLNKTKSSNLAKGQVPVGRRAMWSRLRSASTASLSRDGLTVRVSTSTQISK